MAITKTLKFGSTGDQVKELQRQLALLGFFKGAIGGNFQSLTTAAVKQFQLARGLKVDGIVGPQTRAQLYTSAPKTGKLVTKHLNRMLSDRHIADELRAKIESLVFPGGVTPEAFFNRQWRPAAILVMNALVSMEVREVGGQNKGYWVGLIQSVLGKFTDKGDGEPWCMSTIQNVIAFLEDYFQYESQVFDSEHCMTTLRRTKKAAPNLVHTDPNLASIIIWEHVKNGKPTDAGHTELILLIKSLTTWETGGGNTSDSNMREGDGLYRKVRGWVKTGSLPVRGFIDMWSMEKVPTV